MPKCKDHECIHRNAVLSDYCAAHTTEDPPAFFAIEWGMGGGPVLELYEMALAGTVFAFQTEQERDRFVNAERPDVNRNNSGLGVRQAIPAFPLIKPLENPHREALEAMMEHSAKLVTYVMTNHQETARKLQELSEKAIYEQGD